MKYFFIVSLIFSMNISILGMDKPVDLFPELGNNIIAQNFSYALLQYQKGNKEIAIPLLCQTYEQFQCQRLTCYIPPTTLQKVHHFLSIANDAQGNFDQALFFAQKAFPAGGNNTDKGIIYRHKAKKAHAQGDIASEQDYYQQAFRLFQGAALSDQRAAKYYEHALANGIGCTKNISDLRKHYLDQVKKHYSQKIIGIRENFYKKSMQKLLLFAENDINTQCILAKAYSTTQESNKYGFIACDTTSLEWAEKAFFSLTKMPSTSVYPPETFSLFQALENLCTYSEENIKQKAFILKTYLDFLFALKNQQTLKIKSYCSNPNAPLLQCCMLNLLCANPLSPEAIYYIKNIIFNDKNVLDFYENEGRIAILLLKHMMENDANTIKKYKDFFHILIGGYEYVNNNLKAAYNHFKECTQYDKDLYLQALNIQINPEKIKYVGAYLKKKWKQGLSQRDLKGQEIIARACDYNSLLPAAEKIAFCEQFLLQSVVSPEKQNSLEYLRFLLSIHDLYKSETTSSDEIQRKAVIISEYFDFFSALHMENEEKIKFLLNAPSLASVKLRSSIYKTFIKHKTNEAKNIIFEDKEFQELYKSDSFILIPLLETLLEQKNSNLCSNLWMKSDECHYILAGLLYSNKNYQAAQQHFLRCNYKDDFYTQTKVIETITDTYRVQYIHLLPHASKTIIKNLRPLRKKNTVSENAPRERKAKQIITSVCIHESEAYISSLLDRSCYSECYEYIYHLAQLQLPATYPTITQIMTTVEKKIATQQGKKEYKKLMHLTDRDTAFDAIQKTIDDKHTGNECLCDCLATCLRLHNNRQECDTTTTIDFKRKYLPYLICSLQHKPLTEAEQIRKKQDCGEIACQIAQIDKSILLFDQAIECGNCDALYYKSLLLSALPSAKDTVGIQIDLLEHHIQHNSNLKDASLKLLGIKYFKEDNQKSFIYLDQITHKDNDVLDTLTYLYIEGIKSGEEWFLEPSLEKAQANLTAMISNLTNKDSFYYHLLFLRGSIFYKQNKLHESLSDLCEVTKNTENKEHQMCALWLMGIIKILVQEDNDAVPKDALLLLELAFNLLFPNNEQEAALNKKNNTIDGFHLCNDPLLIKHIQKIIHTIMEEKKDDPVSVYFCALIGKVILEQKSASSEQRKFAIDCLRYSHAQGSPDAYLGLLRVSNQEVDICEKIYYLEKNLYRNPELTHRLQGMLTALYPKTIYEQIRLIIYFINNNQESLLQQYLSQIYAHHAPVYIDPADLEYPFSDEEMKQLIDRLLTIESIKNPTDSFMEKIKNKENPTTQEHFCALFSGSLLSYSRSKPYLELAIRYLSTCSTVSHSSSDHAKVNLGYAYYHLALCYQQPERDMNSIVRYLLLACHFKNAHAILALSKFLLDETPETMPFALEIIAHLEGLHKTHPNIITLSLLKRHAQQESLKKQPIILQEFPLQQNTPQAKTYQQTSRNIMLEVLEEQKSFTSPDLLIANPEERVCEGPSKVSLSELYPILLQKSNPDSCQLFHCAIWFISKNNTAPIITCIEKAIAHGIAPLSPTTNVFKNQLVINFMCMLIRDILQTNKKHLILLLLKNIKRIMQENKINIKVFEEFYKKYYKTDLSKYPAWKNAKK